MGNFAPRNLSARFRSAKAGGQLRIRLAQLAAMAVKARADWAMSGGGQEVGIVDATKSNT